MRILVMGLSGTGKTTLAQQLHLAMPEFTYLNADDLRKENADWDFSTQGRIRQAQRMRDAADENVIYDLIAPLEAQRRILDANYVIWLDTLQQSSYADTDAVFEPPHVYNLRITKNNPSNLAKVLADLKNFI
jgi:uridine kinase